MPQPTHHLILVRASDPELSGSIGCCCRIGREDVRWSASGPAPAPRDEAILRFGELYRALRATFGDRLRITVLDPRNVIAFVSLVVRDALRFGVPARAALRAVGATSAATAVLDGRLMYSGVAPPTAEVVELVSRRLGLAPSRAEPGWSLPS